MSRFTEAKPTTQNGLTELYADISAKGFAINGSPLSCFRALSQRPDLLGATWGMCQALLVDGELPPTLTQMIATAISINNHCDYCAGVHTGALQALGVPEEHIESCVSDPSFASLPAPHREAVAFAVKISKDPHSADDADYERLADAGLTEGEVMEIVMVVALTGFLNTWADASGLIPKT